MSIHVEKSSGIAVPGGGIPRLRGSCCGRGAGLDEGQAAGEPGDVPFGKARGVLQGGQAGLFGSEGGAEAGGVPGGERDARAAHYPQVG